MTTNKIKSIRAEIEKYEMILKYIDIKGISLEEVENAIDKYYNKLLTKNIRRKAAEECELLVDKEYNITEKIDKFFI